MAADDALTSFDTDWVRRLSETALEAMGAAREEIDALNVYPVPDGDTGTNLFLTLEAAHAMLVEQLERPDPPTQATTEPDLAGCLSAYARGALLGARGNSGVILSQLVGAFVKRLVAARSGESAPRVVADGLRQASEAAYAAVGDPVEGTILTVAREAAAAARAAAGADTGADTGADPGSDPGADTRAPADDGTGDHTGDRAAADTGAGAMRALLGRVIGAAAAQAREALARTPEQLPVLRDAGVVDAGGRGLCVLLDAAETVLTGRRPATTGPALGTRSIPVPTSSGDLRPGGPSYEVMYLIDAPDDVVPTLREQLAPLGDSLVVVGGDGLWNVHVHVDDVGAAVEAGIQLGRPHRIRVRHFADQPGAPEHPRSGRAVVAVAAGDGLGRLFTDSGAAVVPGAGRRPSTGELVATIVGTGAEEVVLLPNDRDSVAVAEAAAREVREDPGVRAVVIPTTAQVQGLAALAVHEPGRPFGEDLLHMTSAARHARSGAVTVAVRRAITTGGPCQPGDVLGAVEGDFVLVGSDLFTVAVEVAERLLGGGGELVTLVAGAGGDELAERCADYLASHHPTVDVMVYDGGQERYPLLLGVE